MTSKKKFCSRQTLFPLLEKTQILRYPLQVFILKYIIIFTIIAFTLKWDQSYKIGEKIVTGILYKNTSKTGSTILNSK